MKLKSWMTSSKTLGILSLLEAFALVVTFAINDPWLPIFGYEKTITDSEGHAITTLTVPLSEISQFGDYYVLAVGFYYLFQLVLFGFCLIFAFRFFQKKPIPLLQAVIVVIAAFLFLVFGLLAFVWAHYWLPLLMVGIASFLGLILGIGLVNAARKRISENS